MRKSTLTTRSRGDWTKRAALYAQLASIDPLKIGEEEQSRLAEVVVRPWARGQSTNYKAVAVAYFPDVHRQAWSWIGSLLAGEPVKPGDRIGQVTWYLEKDAVQSSWPAADQVLHGELTELILRRPFPFRRCAACGRVFVRRGKRTTCSAACWDAWRRRGQKSEAYKSYMRGYMKLWRGLQQAKEEGNKKEVALWERLLEERKRRRLGLSVIGKR
jgi:hypothetical protein